jgi:hypothetical protein
MLRSNVFIMVIKVNDDYINFGDFVRKECGMQCQYASFYLKGIAGYPDLSKDLRLKGDLKDYHSILIHKDDAIEFKKRFGVLHEWVSK